MSIEQEQSRPGRVRWTVSLALMVTMGWGCTAVAAGTSSPVQGGSEKPVPLVDQGWDENLRNKYYYTPQGSRMMPYAWFMALERAGSTERFASPGNMSRYGWVYPLTSSELNPGGLPVGFVKEDVGVPGTGPSVGMSCAACHTNDITYNGRAYRVDGAPTLANFPQFIVELSDALVATALDLDSDKFRRFAAEVAPTQLKLAEAGDQDKKKEIEALKVLLTAFASEFSGRAAMYAAMPAGPGRLDALTQIVNSMAVIDLDRPDNLRLPSAPVSYPHLWLAPKLDFVQWSPIVSNPLARNIGEVMGVFGHTMLSGAPEHLFTSTVKSDELFLMESWLDELKPPVWPEKTLGTINRQLAEEGRGLFQKDCRGCHNMPPFDMTPKEDNLMGLQFIKITSINYKKVGTDTVYSQALLNRVVNTGELDSILFGGRASVPSTEFFLQTVAAVVKREMDDVNMDAAKRVKYSGYRFSPPKKAGEEPQQWAPKEFNTLKAGPLLGIWATGPFLHNGSVPNIYELLSPPEKRSKVFWVGSRELDTRKLGFKSTEKDLMPAERSGLYRFDTTQFGNSNGGHRYPSDRNYSEREKMAVIEFLKLAALPE